MIHVACAADGAYLPHCAAMVDSLLSHHEPARLHVHFLHGAELGAAAREPLADMVRARGAGFTAHEMRAEDVAGLPASGRIPPLMWYRVRLPDVLADLDRVLYLDADTLVCEPLTELWQTDLGGYSIAAVDNVLERSFADRAARLGLPPGQRYFNSGVLLLNLAQMRVDRCADALVAYGRAHAAQPVWPDQDALNVVLGARRRPLHPRWNCQNTMFYFPGRSAAVFGAEAVRAAVRAPAILHFEGPGLAKPWHYLCKHPHRARYWRHRARTPWPTGVLEGRTWANRLLRMLPMALLPDAYDALRRLKAATLARVTA